MLTIIVGTAVGFVIASIIMFMVGFALVMNKKFMMWYTKKLTAVTKDVAEQMIEEYEDLY